MAISNYTELQAAVSEWAHRSVSQVTDFIRLAEIRINAKLSARVAEVDADLTATIGSRFIALPAGFKSPYALWMTTYNPRQEVFYVTPEELPVITTDSQPRYYTIDGTNIAFDCPNNLAYTYTLRYKKSFDIASTSTNDILTTYPDVYLFGSLVEASMFARDSDARDVWEARFQEALENAFVCESKNYANATMMSDMSNKSINIYNGGF